MISVRLEDKLEERLNVLSKSTGRSTSYYIGEAVREFLDEHEDVLDAISRLEDETDEVIPFVRHLSG
ncbi:MAG: ribbon-helix-helix protein, CopG family [Nitrospirae bacterium]|nr:ribbon-helix-helix protein, CopG family [Nitrospirota bacterium]